MMNNSFVDADYGPIVEDVEQIVCMYLLKKKLSFRSERFDKSGRSQRFGGMHCSPCRAV